MPYNPLFEASPLQPRNSSYQEKLNCWAVVRLLPDMQRITVARLRSRSDADGHLRFLQRHVPEGEFVVMFDRSNS